MPADQVGEEPPDPVAHHLLARSSRPATRSRRNLGVVHRPQEGERLRYVLEERVAELELRLREREGRDEVHELEVRALQLEIDLRAGYVAHLEAAQAGLHRQIAEQAGERAGLLIELERLRVEVAGLSGELTAVRNRRAYRVADRLVPVARFVLAPVLVARRLVRKLIRR